MENAPSYPYPNPDEEPTLDTVSEPEVDYERGLEGYLRITPQSAGLPESENPELSEQAKTAERDRLNLEPGDRTKADALTLFLSRASRVPLLTKDLEVSLSKRIKAGQLAKKLQDNHELSEDEDGIVDKGLNLLIAKKHAGPVLLEDLVEDGQRAKLHLVEANLRLVVSIAKKYPQQDLELMELIQEGYIGLNRAAEKFDWRKGFKFSTYATWWIKQACSRALSDKSRTIRIPVHVVEKLYKITHAKRRLAAELGKEPTLDEISKELEFDKDDIKFILHHSQVPKSLDQPVGEEQESEFGDFLIDHSELSPDEAGEIIMRKAMLEAALTKLSERERRVIEMRYGLDGSEPLTLEEAGREFNITRERIRQIENNALKRLEDFPEVQGLREE